MHKSESFIEVVEEYFYGYVHVCQHVSVYERCLPWLVILFSFSYENEELTDRITEWARKNCQTFNSKGGDEQPLEHTNLYNEYCALFERLIETFLASNNMCVTDFYKELQQEQGLCGRGKILKGLNTTFGSVLLSATDFFDFCDMMHDVNQGGEAVFCPPLIECHDEDYTVNETKAEAKDNTEENIEHSCKSQSK